MYLGRAICALLDLCSKTQTELAKAIDVRRPTVTALINDGTRPHPQTLGALCDWWDDPHHGVECLLAHLRDEIERAGQSQLAVEIRQGKTAGRDTLGVLIGAYEHDDACRQLLDELALLIARDGVLDE